MGKLKRGKGLKNGKSGQKIEKYLHLKKIDKLTRKVRPKIGRKKAKKWLGGEKWQIKMLKLYFKEIKENRLKKFCVIKNFEKMAVKISHFSRKPNKSLENVLEIFQFKIEVLLEWSKT